MIRTPGYLTDKHAVLTRLRRIEGQALESVALLLLDQHLRHCLAHAASAAEREQMLAEANLAIARMVRS